MSPITTYPSWDSKERLSEGTFRNPPPWSLLSASVAAETLTFLATGEFTTSGPTVLSTTTPTNAPAPKNRSIHFHNLATSSLPLSSENLLSQNPETTGPRIVPRIPHSPPTNAAMIASTKISV